MIAIPKPSEMADAPPPVEAHCRDGEWWAAVALISAERDPYMREMAIKHNTAQDACGNLGQSTPAYEAASQVYLDLSAKLDTACAHSAGGILFKLLDVMSSISPEAGEPNADFLRNRLTGVVADLRRLAGQEYAADLLGKGADTSGMAVQLGQALEQTWAEADQADEEAQAATDPGEQRRFYGLADEREQRVWVLEGAIACAPATSLADLLIKAALLPSFVGKFTSQNRQDQKDWEARQLSATMVEFLERHTGLSAADVGVRRYVSPFARTAEAGQEVTA